jgi:hypothetical protein
MIALAVLLLSALHPGLAFGGQWHAANWSLRSGKEKKSSEPRRKLESVSDVGTY